MARVAIERGVPYLDQILSLRFRNERLKLGRRECIDQASFGDHEEKDLSASEDGQLVRLISNGSVRVVVETRSRLVCARARRHAN